MQPIRPPQSASAVFSGFSEQGETNSSAATVGEDKDRCASA
jgi:hypothetical protein